MADKVKDPYEFNPLSWGMVFFTFWLALKAVPNASRPQNPLSWGAVVISFLLWLSIILPPWRKILEKPRVKKIYLPTIFCITLAGYVIGWVTSIVNIKGNLDFNVSFFFGLAWLFIWLIILMRITNRLVGILGSVAFIGFGVRYLIQSNYYSAVTLIILGIIGVLVVIIRPKFIWHESIGI